MAPSAEGAAIVWPRRRPHFQAAAEGRHLFLAASLTHFCFSIVSIAVLKVIHEFPKLNHVKLSASHISTYQDQRHTVLRQTEFHVASSVKCRFAKNVSKIYGWACIAQHGYSGIMAGLFVAW